MTTIDNAGRPAFMYDEEDETWYAISGRVSTSANYIWTGAHQYDNNIINNGAITATLKFNSFLNPAARTSAIAEPGIGLITFLQQDAGGNTINKFQYWNGSAWTDIANISFSATQPFSPNIGNIWINSNTMDMFVYNGTLWVQTGGSGGLDPFFLAGL
jgi:hypothetical protein